MPNKEKSIRYDVIYEINKIRELIQTNGDCAEIMHQINYLKVFVKDDSNIDKELEKLEKFAEGDDLGKEFLDQINFLLLFIETKVKEYIPINQNFKELYLNKEEQKGLSFLCNDLDRRTGGILPGTLCTIVGGPGSMKTTLAMNISYNAVKKGKNVCYISLEESPLQLYSKLLSRVSVDMLKNIPTADVIKNSLSEKDKKTLLEEAYPHLEGLPGLFYFLGERDIINYEIPEIERKLNEINDLMKSKEKEKQGNEGHGIDVLVIDHIQLLKYADKEKDEYKLINNYVSFFRRLSLSFLNDNREISVILLSQVNREGVAYSQKHDGAFLMQHVAEASEIERASTYIISTYTDAMVQTSKLLKMGALKLRNAGLPVTTVNVFADGQFYQVGDTEVPEQKEYSIVELESTPIEGIQSSSLDDLLGEFSL